MPLFPSNLYLVDLDGLFQLLIYDIVGIKALNDIGQDLIWFSVLYLWFIDTCLTHEDLV